MPEQSRHVAIVWAPSLDKWWPPALVTGLSTDTIHAAYPNGVPHCGVDTPEGEPWQVLPVTRQHTPRDVFEDWTPRVCRTCFTVYEQDSLW